MIEQIITPTQIYLLTRCDAIREWLLWTPGFSVLSIVCIVAAAVLMGISLFAGNGRYDLFDGLDDEMFAKTRLNIRSWAKRSAVVGFSLAAVVETFSMAAALIPTNREMAAIVVVPRIANSQSVQEIGSGIVQLAKDWMEELSPKKQQPQPKADPKSAERGGAINSGSDKGK